MCETMMENRNIIKQIRSQVCAESSTGMAHFNTRFMKYER